MALTWAVNFPVNLKLAAARALAAPQLLSRSWTGADGDASDAQAATFSHCVSDSVAAAALVSAHCTSNLNRCACDSSPPT
eukprot:3041244-Rhodomonas_salina.2